MMATAAAQENADNAKSADDAGHKMSEDYVNKLSDQMKEQLVSYFPLTHSIILV